MPEQTPPRDDTLKSVLQTFIAGLSTRAQIAQLELSAAKSNAVRFALYVLACAVAGILALIFISVALLVIFWDDHRVLVSCCIAVVYVVLFIFCLSKTIGLASSLSSIFTETKQILSNDVAALSQVVSSADNSEESSVEIEGADDEQ